MRFEIRRARPNDAEALAALSGQLGYPSTQAQIVDRLGGPLAGNERAILVAEVSPETVVGWIHVEITRRLMVDSFAEVGGLVVDEPYRGNRIGRALLESAKTWAAERGYRLLRLRSNAKREGAKRFYLTNEFELRKQQNVFDHELDDGGLTEARRDQPYIYFAGAIRGGRQDRHWYHELIRHLSGFGCVLTEHVGEDGLDHRGESQLGDRDIFLRDTSWLDRADVMVAEVSVPSLGVGYEIAEAARRGIPVLCLYREMADKALSAMIAGNEKLSVEIYRSPEEALRAVDNFLRAWGDET